MPAAWRHRRSRVKRESEEKTGKSEQLVTAGAVLCNKQGTWATRLVIKRLRKPTGWTKSSKMRNKKPIKHDRCKPKELGERTVSGHLGKHRGA